MELENFHLYEYGITTFVTPSLWDLIYIQSLCVMTILECIQVGNQPLYINLYTMLVNNDYNSHVVFDRKTKSYKPL